MTSKYPSALVWIDAETTGLPEGNDYSGVEILEIALIVTDFDLKPHFAYHGIVQMNDDIKTALRNPKNEWALRTHHENGLLKESKESEDTLAIIESEIIGLFKNKTTQDKGEFMIAGSGVAAYDQVLLKDKMPELASWFAYYPLDIGINRRTARILSGGKDLVSPVRESFQEGAKAHRALADVKAHFKEAIEWQKFYHWAAEQQEKS